MRTDFDGRRTGLSILREVSSLALQGLITPLALAPARHRPLRDPGIRTVVFVHGLAATSASLLPLQAWLAARGHRRQLSFAHRSTGSIEAIAIQLKRFIDANVKGGRIDLVCHSMGGLIGRVYLQCLGGDRRVDRFITLATPHGGTHATSWVPSALVRQMTPGSPFLTWLDAQPEPQGVHTVTIGAGSDLIVLPAHHARAPFGAYHHIEGAGHTSVMLSPTAMGLVSSTLALRVMTTPRAIASASASGWSARTT